MKYFISSYSISFIPMESLFFFIHPEEKMPMWVKTFIFFIFLDVTTLMARTTEFLESLGPRRWQFVNGVQSLLVYQI